MRRIYLNNQQGFTLAEIMIVIGIIMIVAVVAIPAMVRGKLNGNETGAIAAVKTLGNACNLYLFQSNTFPADLPTLSSAVPPYVNANLTGTSAANPKDGYYYTYALVGTTGFSIIGRPSRWQVTGARCFSMDQTGRMLYCNTAANCNPNLDL